MGDVLISINWDVLVSLVLYIYTHIYIYCIGI